MSVCSKFSQLAYVSAKYLMVTVGKVITKNNKKGELFIEMHAIRDETWFVIFFSEKVH